MCIIHKGFRGKRAVSPALIVGGNLIVLSFEIPHYSYNSPLQYKPTKKRLSKSKFRQPLYYFSISMGFYKTLPGYTSSAFFKVSTAFFKSSILRT